MKTFFPLLFSFAFIPFLFSQVGTLDLTFDMDGKVTTALEAMSIDRVQALAIQPDQKIVAAGYARGGGAGQDFALTRYHPDGSLDVSFGVGGKILTDFNAGADVGTSIVLQPDGKIIVAGYATNGVRTDFALARYLENGTLDPSFGVNGQQTTAVGPGDSEGRAVGIQGDGKIIVVGTAYLHPTHGLFALTRYDAQGVLDSTFGINGMITTALDSVDNHALAMAIRPDGKIIAAGYAYHGNYFDFAVAQYEPDGLLDTTFGMNGRQFTDIQGFNDYGQSITLQSDGKIMVAGYTEAGTTMQSFALVRYDAEGTLDPDFSTDGKIFTSISGVSDRIQALALQADGKIVAVGYSFIPSFNVYRFAIVRYFPTGSLDNEFGKVTTAFAFGEDQAYAVAIQADGKIVAGGGSTSFDFALARYLPGEVVRVDNGPFSSHALFIYPNPVAEQVVMEYSLDKAEPVSIGLYDQSGKVIRLFAHQEQQSAGKHTRSLLLPGGLPSGHHVIVLTTPSGRGSWQLVK